MRHRVAPAAVALFTLVACHDSPTVLKSAPAAPNRSASASYEGQYIVVYSPGETNVASRSASLAAAHGGDVTYVYQSALKGFAGHFTEPEAETLRHIPGVAFVEKDGPVSIVTTQLGATWGLDRVSKRALPLDSTYTYGATGAGVHAYIIDTGIRTTHSEFEGRASFDYDTVDSAYVDCNGHGTHVSGTIGGATYGVAKAVQLHGVRVLNCGGSGSYAGVIAGIDWVTANHLSPAVANMSLGGGFSDAMNLAVTNSIAAGVTYALAAGNNNGDACLGSPGSTPAAITVGATGQTDARASFSNFGTCVAIFAPGVGITSAWNGSDTDTKTISGTSMATPHVAGVAALYLEANPLATPADVKAGLIANATADVVGNPGLGSPNLFLYMGFISTGTPPVADFTVACTVAFICTLDGSISTSVGTIVSWDWDLGKTPDPLVSGVLQVVDYYQPAPRTVKLTVTASNGRTGTITKTFMVP